MQTRKLYYEDAYIRDFEAEVLSCEKAKDGWQVILSATAFFPEEGGQTADTGALGAVRVLDVHEKDGAIYHLTDGPLAVGETVTGHLDWEERFRKMQTHTGEHIVSGLIHSTYGYDNVGFHLTGAGCTIDFNGELSRAQLDDIERRANEAVWQGLRVRTKFPMAWELKEMDYRSKLDLTQDVRIVCVEGVDMCACCAPHVSSTGQIGVIKLLDFMRHRGGVRIWMKTGSDALADYEARYAGVRAFERAPGGHRRRNGEARRPAGRAETGACRPAKGGGGGPGGGIGAHGGQYGPLRRRGRGGAEDACQRRDGKVRRRVRGVRGLRRGLPLRHGEQDGRHAGVHQTKRPGPSGPWRRSGADGLRPQHGRKERD